MTREIKFRGWVKKKKKMYGEYYAGWVDYIRVCGEPDINGTDIQIINEQGYCVYYTFNEVELMQCTGFKNKNDEEIYDGDIIQTISCDGIKLSKFQVKWNNDFNKWEKIRQDGEIYDMDKISEENKITIGNIYENPELRVDK